MGSSPVSLLLHKKKGLFISFRGALGINEYIELPNNSKEICTPLRNHASLLVQQVHLTKTVIMSFDVKNILTHSLVKNVEMAALSEDPAPLVRI